MAHTALLFLGYTALAQTTSGQAAPTSNSQLVIWAIVLLGMAVALFLTELFVPSGGIIGIASAVCLIAGIVMLFQINTTLGLIGAIVSVIAIPFAFAAGLWIWPQTPIGRALILGSDEEQEESDLDGQQPLPSAAHHADIAAGTEGKALTELRPVGTCLLDGKRQECLSVSGVIEPGVRVKVVSADGMQIKVQPL
jgi:membrane-bound ClpP family serine protease